MLASTLVPAPAGWVPARVPGPRDARRALLRNALIVSSTLHLTAGFLLSYLLREPLTDGTVTLAMRPRIVLVPPGTADLTPLRIARTAPGRIPPVSGVPVPVSEEAPSPGPALAAWFPVPGPVPGASAAGSGETGAPDARALPPPPQSAALPLGARVDEAPRVIRRVEPAYPAFALEAGLTGRVVLHVQVGTDGTVREIRVAEGSKIFVEAATQAVSRWLFRPARVGTRPVPIWVEIPVTFRL